MEMYIDDILVKSLHAEDHLTHFVKMFDVLRMYKMKLNLNNCTFRVSLGKFLGFMVNQRGIEANSNKIRVVLEMKAPQTVKEVQCLTGRIAALNCFVSKATNKCLPFFRILQRASKLEWPPNVSRYLYS